MVAMLQYKLLYELCKQFRLVNEDKQGFERGLNLKAFIHNTLHCILKN